jgi:hypothetical protein
MKRTTLSVALAGLLAAGLAAAAWGQAVQLNQLGSPQPPKDAAAEPVAPPPSNLNGLNNEYLAPLPLKDGETIKRTASGCYVVWSTTAQSEKYWTDNTGWRWTGACRTGLAHGMGRLVNDAALRSEQGNDVRSMDTEYVFGNAIGGPTAITVKGMLQSTHYNADKVGVMLQKVGEDLQTPVWGDFGQSSQVMLMPADFYTAVQTWSETCQWWDRNKLSAAQKKVNQGCSDTNQFKLYMVWITTKTDTTGVRNYCPNPQSPVGCETVWRNAIAPIQPQVQQVIARTKTLRDERRAELTARYGQWETDLAAAVKAKKDAEAATARKAEEERVAAEAAAVAERDRQTKETQAGLAKLNAGQLFAKADELEEQGRPDLARMARRELVSRFPDSPLAQTAAQQMANSPAPAGGAATGAPPASGGGASSAGASGAGASGPSASGASASGPAATPDDGLFSVKLPDRWKGVYEDKVLVRLSDADYDRVATAVKSCEQARRSMDCADAYTYPVRGVINEFRIEHVPGSGPAGPWGDQPRCKYTPSSYSTPNIQRQAPEVTCALALQKAIHEWMTDEVEGIRGAGQLVKTAPVLAGTSSGNCDADLKAFRDLSPGVRAKINPTNLMQSMQVGMYLSTNMYRILTTSCKGRPEAARASEYLHSAGQEMRTCQIMSSAPNTCVPKAP